MLLKIVYFHTLGFFSKYIFSIFWTSNMIDFWKILKENENVYKNPSAPGSQIKVMSNITLCHLEQVPYFNKSNCTLFSILWKSLFWVLARKNMIKFVYNGTTNISKRPKKMCSFWCENFQIFLNFFGAQSQGWLRKITRSFFSAHNKIVFV